MSERKIYGIHAVTQRLKSGLGVRQLIVRPGRLNQRLSELVELAEKMECQVTRDEINAGSIAHQGVALVVNSLGIRSESDLDVILSHRDGPGILLILDGVTDPRNLGACIRSAATFGVYGIMVPKDNSAALNEAAIKVASGGGEIVPVVQVVNLARTMDRLKKEGIWMIGTVVEDAEPLASLDLTGDIAIVMGAEGAGMRRKTRERCDFLAQIPMAYGDLGLNVSVATGICLYEVQNQRESLQRG